MPAPTFGVDRAITGSALDQRRRSERRACRLRVAIRTPKGDFHVRLDNISAGGVGFTADPVIALRPGEKLLLSDERLGSVACVVRWAAHPRYGAEFEVVGKPLARVNAFYDSLAPAPGELT